MDIPLRCGRQIPIPANWATTTACRGLEASPEIPAATPLAMLAIGMPMKFAGKTRQRSRGPAAEEVSQNMFVLAQAVEAPRTVALEDLCQFASEVCVNKTCMNVVLVANGGCVAECFGYGGNRLVGDALVSGEFCNIAMHV